MKLSEFVKAEYGKSISECTNEELYYALLTLTKKMASGKQHGNSKKKLYYISAEFLIGKLLSNNLINLGIYDEVKEELAQNGKDICEIEEFENEPSLGNGGLGRLAACFIDSIATLGLNGDGVGLNYHFGLFRQIFENNMQTTVPDPWLTEKSWLTKTDVTYDIKFKGMTVKSRMYDIDVIGYNNTSNKLHLFDVESVDESIVEDGINFNKEDIKKIGYRWQESEIQEDSFDLLGLKRPPLYWGKIIKASELEEETKKALAIGIEDKRIAKSPISIINCKIAASKQEEKSRNCIA